MAACAPKKPPSRRPPPEPQVLATAVTIETTVQPQNKTFDHSILIAGGRVRSEAEIDRWRLFDLDHQQITFVDDIRRTYETRPLNDFIDEQREAAGGDLPGGAPRADVISSGAKRVILGVEASQLLIHLGGYQRELWIGDPPSIPAGFFAVWFATQSIDSKYEPIMRDADEALLNVRGFPLIDHAELPYGATKMVVDRRILRIEKRNVAASVFRVNPAYRQVTGPDANRPPALSPPDGQSTPAAGSQSSATDRRNP